jgi:ABC-type nitrate/sulfonate/bicarbonate transport system permease component
MAPAGLSLATPLASRLSPARRLQCATLLMIWASWEAIAASGVFYKGVVPSCFQIVAALAHLIADLRFWFNLAVTGVEIAFAIAIGGGTGLLVGLLLGGNRFLGAALEPYLAALAATPKIIILPIVYLMFGVGPVSKVAIGAFASFVPVALSAASGMRQISPVLVRVGRSLDLSHRQMVHKIYLPALVEPVATGLRIALGAAIAVCLIAEIKFSRIGLGAMVIESFNRSRFAEVYAVLIVIISLAIGGNVLVDRLGGGRRRAPVGRSVAVARPGQPARALPAHVTPRDFARRGE